MKKSFFIGFMSLILISLIGILIFSSINSNKSGSLIELDYKTIVDKVDNKDSFILVISQSTCSHCATYRPKLLKISKEYGIDIFYIDYDKESEDNRNQFLKEFNLSGATPTTIFIKDGKEVSLLNRLEGDMSESKAIEKFKKMGFIEE